MRILFLTPPMTQLNTPYPATAYLMGYFKENPIDRAEFFQADPAIDLVLKLMSPAGLRRIFQEIQNQKLTASELREKSAVKFFLDHFSSYESTIESVISFLQGKDSSVGLRIQTRRFLPEGDRFKVLDEMGVLAGETSSDPLHWAFGQLGVHDRAKFLASLYLDDLVDVIRQGIDSHFEFSKYGEKLAASQPHFDPLLRSLNESSLVTKMLDEIIEELFQTLNPDVVGLSVPFPGNVLGAFRIAKKIRQIKPQCKILLGGGYANTELRSLKDPRVFDWVDFITLDDGEIPVERMIKYLMGSVKEKQLVRTFLRSQGQVVYLNSEAESNIEFKKSGATHYQGLNLNSYLSVFEMLNPMHRLWSDGRWNKLTLAHGCYWRKCNFCDLSLDYIGRYESAEADLLVDRIEKIINETGNRGFHFVDEAAPPALLKAISQKLIERKVPITWWTNIRFEKTFSKNLCELMAQSGCIAVSGGLEVASDRLLKLMNKGVSVEQVARVTRAMSDAGILVHAYLMYGFPTQTEQETVDSAERVRQLFEEGCIQSAFWHRFAATIHSPIGKNPERFGITLRPREPVDFAENDLPFTDPSGVDHDLLGRGLNRALYNWMYGIGLETSVHKWFEKKLSKTQVDKNLIRNAIEH